MLLRIAWRNIWRNKRRSAIIIASMVVGYVALIFMDSLTAGMIRQMLTNQVGIYTAHIEIHRKGYIDNPVVQNFIPETETVEEVLENSPGISSFTKRVLAFAMITSASGSAGVTIVGIEPEKEKNVTTIGNYIVEGSYLSGKEREIMLSSELAEKLEVGLLDKVIVMASGIDGTIGTELFRVVGIFRSPSVQFDRANIYIPIEPARKLISMKDGAMEFAAICKSTEAVDNIKEELATRLDDSMEVVTYKELHPLLLAQFDIFRQMMFIFYAILGVAVMFGVINTMLMAVMERIHEFGILISLGMKVRKLFAMILVEGLLLGVAGTILGIISGIAISALFSHSGINLSVFKESLTYFGAGAIIYPVLTTKGILTASSIVPVTSIIGTIYPGFKVARLEPVEAIRHI